MTRMFGMVFGCVIAAGLVSLGLRYVPGVEVATDEAGDATMVMAAPAPAPIVRSPEPEEVRGPKVDVLRVERDGATLVSGRGTPGAEIEIVLGEQKAGSAPVDAQGNFVAFLTLPESEVPQALNLRERDDSGFRAGSQSFVVETRRPVPVALAPAPHLEGAPTGQDLHAVKVEEEAAELVQAEVASTEQTGTVQNSQPAATLLGEGDPVHAAAPEGTAVEGEAAAASMTVDYSPELAVDLGDVPAAPGPNVLVAAMPETAPGQIDRSDPPRVGDISTGRTSGDVPPPAPAVQDMVRRNEAAPVRRSEDRLVAGPNGSPTVQVPPQTEAPRVLRVEDGGLSVVQDGAPRPLLSIDTIRYASDGTVVLGGRAPEATSVRVYLDDRPVDDVESQPDGQWRLDMPALAERTYTLRVDQLDAGGEVTARAETPFRPESPDTLDALRGMVEDGVRRVTVQPGFTLWAIAESNYGDGLSFVRVFEANADKIGNPDLIYPGQIFAVPD